MARINKATKERNQRLALEAQARGPLAGLATFLGSNGYAGSAAEMEDRKERQRRPGLYFSPRDEAEHDRCGEGSGESDYCNNCGKPFMDHHNGRCR